MYDENYKSNYPPICQMVPGYSYYSGIGTGLAGALVDLVEWMFGWRK